MKHVTRQRMLPSRDRLTLYAHVHDTKKSVIRFRVEEFLARFEKESS